jgi:hypothetical protein
MSWGLAGDRCLDEIVLRLEVVVDVAGWDVRRPRDVSDRRLLDALPVDQLARGSDQTVALALLASGRVSHLTLGVLSTGMEILR